MGSDRSVRLSIIDGGRSRIDRPDGSYTITDTSKDRTLSVNPNKQEARMEQWVNSTLYELLKNRRNDSSIRQLQPQNLDGRDVIGFRMPLIRGGEDYAVILWADANSKVPVRIEAERAGKASPLLIIFDGFVFDQELDAELFTLEPPAGYKLRSRTLPIQPLPSEPELRDPVVTPLVGIGPVKFGMSSGEVEKLLGEPDDVEDSTVPGIVYISYRSRGLEIRVSTARGAEQITCERHHDPTRGRRFGGETDRGISLDASKADVIRAYGKPSWINSSGTFLEYQKLGASFSFYKDELTSMWFLDSPLQDHSNPEARIPQR